MKNFFFTLAIFLLDTHFGNAQAPDLASPVRLGTSVNTSSEESYPILSPERDRLYFVRTLYAANKGGVQAGQDIWYSKKSDDGTWKTAENRLKKLNTIENNAVIGISKNGKRLYLINSYFELEKRHQGIAFSDFDDRKGVWSRPEELGVEVQVGNNFYGFYMHPDEDILLISMTGDRSLGEEDLYVSQKTGEGQWTKPIHLGGTVNTSGFEISPFLSEDKRTLYFSSSGLEGLGDADIFMTERKGDGWQDWSEPLNLGEGVNSSRFDAYFTVDDQEGAFFASNREGGLSDIYHAQYKKKILKDNSPDSTAMAKETPEQNDTSETESAKNKNTIDESAVASTDAKNGTDIPASDGQPQAQNAKVKVEEGEGSPATAMNEGVDTSKEQENKEETAAKELSNTTAQVAMESGKLPEKVYVLFGFDSFALDPKYRTPINTTADYLLQHDNSKVHIVGYTDDIGDEKYNLYLSEERAETVRKYLKKRGVNDITIQVEGKGEADPYRKNDSKEHRKLNRRVEISFMPRERK